jgi:glycosyltransferase involved in cell wall biosynthesis
LAKEKKESMTIKLSVVLNTKNAARYLERCLQSVKNLADEIVVVDMASTDETVKIAREFGARVYQYPEPEVGFADPAREFLFAKAKGEWLLMIDSDEEITPALAVQIKKIVLGQEVELEEKGAVSERRREQAAVYFIARTNIIFDRALTHSGWFPDYQPRLWQQGALTWKPTVHSVPEIHGPVAYLPASKELSFIHHNYQTVEDFVARSNKYTTLQAQAEETVAREREEAGGEEEEKEDFSAGALAESFFAEWWRRLGAMEGHQDGNHGVMLSLLQAGAELQARAKRWQAAGFPQREFSSREWRELERRFRQNARYWRADREVKRSQGWRQLYWRGQRKWYSGKKNGV